MSQKDINYDHLKQVVDDLGQIFSTKDVSEDARMKNAHPHLVKHSHYHAFVGRALSDHRAELDIKVIQKGTSRGSRWQKISSFQNGSPKRTQIYDHSYIKSIEDKMDEPVTLVCPSCGGKLQVSQDLNRFVCAHCGNEHIIRHSDGTIFIRPVIEQIEGMRDDVVSVKQRIEINNAELALSRINPELSALRSELKALKEKSKKEITLPGMVGCFGLLFIIFGIGAIFMGTIEETALFIIIGIISFVIVGNWPSRTEKKIKQLEERIERLEKKKKANLQIVNR